MRATIAISFRKGPVLWQEPTKEEHPSMGSKPLSFLPYFQHIYCNYIIKDGEMPSLMAIYEMFL